MVELGSEGETRGGSQIGQATVDEGKQHSGYERGYGYQAQSALAVIYPLRAQGIFQDDGVAYDADDIHGLIACQGAVLDDVARMGLSYGS